MTIEAYLTPEARKLLKDRMPEWDRGDDYGTRERLEYARGAKWWSIVIGNHGHIICPHVALCILRNHVDKLLWEKGRIFVGPNLLGAWVIQGWPTPSADWLVWCAREWRRWAGFDDDKFAFTDRDEARVAALAALDTAKSDEAGLEADNG